MRMSLLGTRLGKSPLWGIVVTLGLTLMSPRVDLWPGLQAIARRHSLPLTLRPTLRTSTASGAG